jgi:hypothetical protein
MPHHGLDARVHVLQRAPPFFGFHHLLMHGSHRAAPRPDRVSIPFPAPPSWGRSASSCGAPSPSSSPAHQRASYRPSLGSRSCVLVLGAHVVAHHCLPAPSCRLGLAHHRPFAAGGNWSASATSVKTDLRTTLLASMFSFLHRRRSCPPAAHNRAPEHSASS